MFCRQFLRLAVVALIAILFATAARAFFSVSTDSEKDLPILLSGAGISFVSEGDNTVEISADDVINHLSPGHPEIIFIPQDLISGQAGALPSGLSEGQQIGSEISSEYQMLQGLLAPLTISSEPVISAEVLPYLYSYVSSYFPALNSRQLKKYIRQALQRAFEHYLLLTANTDTHVTQANGPDKAIRMWLLFVYWLNQLAQGSLPHETERLLFSGYSGGLSENLSHVTTQSINNLFNSALELRKLVGEGRDFIVNILLRQIAELSPGSVQGYFINEQFGTLFVHHLSDQTYVVVHPNGLVATVTGQAALKQLLDVIFGQGTATPTAVNNAPATHLSRRLIFSPAEHSQIQIRPTSSQTQFMLAAVRGVVGTALGGAISMIALSRMGVTGTANSFIGLSGGVILGLLSMAGTPLDSLGVARLLSALRLLVSGAMYRSVLHRY